MLEPRMEPLVPLLVGLEGLTLDLRALRRNDAVTPLVVMSRHLPTLIPFIRLHQRQRMRRCQPRDYSCHLSNSLSERATIPPSRTLPRKGGGTGDALTPAS